MLALGAGLQWTCCSCLVAEYNFSAFGPLNVPKVPIATPPERGSNL